jgi:predicted nucleotidyltransferase component of viral defense system
MVYQRIWKGTAMISAVQKMFERYQCRTTDERRNALKEIVQEIALAALDRAHFFNQAAFYGGTALRIFYGLERFSEDLDFSLLQSGMSFNFAPYLQAIHDELASFGFEMPVEQKQKAPHSAIQSAFIKGGTLIHLLKISPVSPPVAEVSPNELIKIKLEVDIDPPAGAAFEVKYRLSPTPYSVRLYDAPSLFAGKLHALLCRKWKSRVKGRDYFDYLWYLQNKIPVNLIHFEARMRQSGAWDKARQITSKDIVELLDEKFSQVDFEQVKNDVRPFIKDTRPLGLWTRDFFQAVSRDFFR